MMSRTQISLDPEVQRRARERAAQLGLSFAEYVRQLLVRDLGERQPRATPSSIFDLGDSGGADIARDKDSLLGEAAAAQQG
jgi:hypothetical protein